MAETLGGVYAPLADERGFVGTKVGGRLALELPCEVPLCNSCGGPMRFVLQVSFADGRFAPYKGAVLFMCTAPFDESLILRCPIWDPDAGANALVLLKDLLPAEPTGAGPEAIDLNMSISPPFSVTWVEAPEVGFAQDQDLSDEEQMTADQEWTAWQKLFRLNKMYGIGLYLQEPESPSCQACGKRTIFAAQFDASLGRLAGKDVCMAELGEDGVGYLYVCEDRCSDRGGAFLYQID